MHLHNFTALKKSCRVEKKHDNCFSKSGLGTVVFLSDSLVTGTFVTWVGDRYVGLFIYFLFKIIYNFYLFLTFCCICIFCCIYFTMTYKI